MKVHRTRSTKDISLRMFSVFCPAAFTRSVYGVLGNDMPVIIANVLVFLQALVIVAFKLKYK